LTEHGKQFRIGSDRIGTVADITYPDSWLSSMMTDSWEKISITLQFVIENRNKRKQNPNTLLKSKHPFRGGAFLTFLT